MDLYLFVRGDVEKTFMNTEWHCEVGKGLCVLPWIKTCWYYLLIRPPPLRCCQSQSTLWSLLPGPLHRTLSLTGTLEVTPKILAFTTWMEIGDTFYSFCSHAYSCRTWWPAIKKPLMKMARWHNIDFISIIHQRCRLSLSCSYWGTSVSFNAEEVYYFFYHVLVLHWLFAYFTSTLSCASLDLSQVLQRVEKGCCTF